MKVGIKSILGVCCNLVLMMISYFFLELPERKWIECTFFLYIITAAINIGFLKLLNKKTITVSIVYYILAILFNLSQIYLGFINSKNYYCIFNLASFEACKEAFSYSFICIHVMIVTYYIVHLQFRYKYEDTYKEINTYNHVRIVNRLFYLFWFIKIVIRAYQFIIAIQFGYLVALVTISDSILGLFTMTADMLSVVFLSYCEERKQKKWLILLIGLEVVFMLTGSRIYGATYIILLIVTVVCRMKLNRAKLFKIAALGVLGLVFMEMIMNGRLEGYGYNLSYLKEGGILFSICKEFGLTMIDTTLAMQHKTCITYLNGLSYYGAVLPIVPNFGGMYTPVLQKMQFMRQLNQYLIWNYGGSNVAESFFNFGYFGVVVFIPIGIVLRAIETKINNYQSIGIGSQLAIVAFLYEFIIWNRNCFYNCIRLPVWLFIIWAFLKHVLTGRSSIKM